MAQGINRASLFDYSNLDQSTLIKGKRFASTGRIPAVQDCEFVDCSFDACDLSGASFSHCIFKGCSFRGCDMNCVRFVAADFENCVFEKGMWINVGIRESVFRHCSFAQTEFEDCLAVGCKFSNVSWSDGSIMHSCFELCTLTGTAFMGAEIHAIFHDCTICQGAFDYLVAGGVTVTFSAHVGSENSPNEAPVAPSTMAKTITRTKGQDPLQQFLVANRPTSGQLLELDHLLDTVEDEAAFQTFLERNPEVLSIAVELGHHGIYVLPQVPFGKRYRADFMVGAKNSMGYFWTGLEIESPRHGVLKKDGHYTQKVQHGIAQVDEWKSYVRNHRALVQRPTSQFGECLPGIEPDFKAWIIIGRDRENVTATQRRAHYLNSQRDTYVQTWDGFRRRLAAAVEGRGRKP